VCRVKFYLQTGDYTISGDRQEMQHLMGVVNTYVDQLLGQETVENFSHRLSVSPQLHLNLTTVQLFDLWVILDQLDQEFLLLPAPAISQSYGWWWLIILGACISLAGYWWHSRQTTPNESPISISQTDLPPPQPMLESKSDRVMDGAVSQVTLRVVNFTALDPKTKLSPKQKASAMLILEDHWQRLPIPPSPNLTLNLTITKTGSNITLQMPRSQRQWQQLLLQNSQKLNVKLEFLPAGKYAVQILILGNRSNK